MVDNDQEPIYPPLEMERVRILSNRFDRLRNQVLLVLAVLGFFLIVMGSVEIYLTVQNSDRVHDNAQRIADNRALTLKVADQRRIAVRDQCDATNRHHNAAISTLARIAATREPNQSLAVTRERRYLQARTRLLIDAFVPLQDCDAVVARLAPPIK